MLKPKLERDDNSKRGHIAPSDTQGLKLDNDAPMLVLGIETTCDETAAAVVERQSDGSGARSCPISCARRPTEHARFGGVVPEIAARAHVDLLDGIVGQAMKDADVGFAQLSAVAAAARPGLIGGVIVGLTTAKAIAMVHDTPLIAVNHLEAHALTPRLTCALAFPYCLFLASGGHTQIVAVVGVGQLCAARHHRRRRHGRGLRQRSQRCCRCPTRAGRRSNDAAAERRRQTVRVSAADARAPGCEFLAVGIEDRGAQRGQPA